MNLRFTKVKLTLLVCFCSILLFAQKPLVEKEMITSQNKKPQDLTIPELLKLAKSDPDTYIKNEKEIYKSRKNIVDKIDVVIFASEAYSIKEDYKNMLRRLFRAKKMVDSAGSEQKIISIRVYAAGKYRLLGLNDRAKKEIFESLDYLNTIPQYETKAFSKADAFVNLAAIDMADSSTVNDQTLAYLDSAAFYTYKSPYLEGIAMLKLAIASDRGTALMILGKFDEAKISYLQGRKIIEQYPEISFASPYIDANLGIVAYEEKEYSTAIKYLNQAIDLAPEGQQGTDIKEGAYEHLAKIYKALGDDKNYILYNEKWQQIAQKKSSGIREGVLQALDEVEKEQKETLYKKHSITINYLIAIAVAIIFGLIFLYIFRMKRNIDLIKESQKKISEIQYENQQLENKVNDSFTEVLELAKNNDPAFLARFQEVYPEYCNNLKKILPDISQYELHFCGMLKLKLSTKDIAEYQFVTPKAIQNRKNKLRKRLNIDPNIDLYDYLDGL